ncbi:FkbM family methyltransferase [Tenuifilum thalassicum]|uniref:FkbM family methyltransferase n=1 Tax=Tenuifilum thalassicum TaxID=2590900 RepID=A0A7D3XEC2_9BACT|nr:FkbM family methyltransferase [Tenuifilum thalassicum]
MNLVDAFHYSKYKLLKISLKFLKRRYIVYRSNYGFKLNLRLDRSVDRRIITRKFENDNIELFKKVVKNSDCVIDIGANIGVYSLIASSLVSEEGIIYSFEPSVNIFKELNNNIKLNDIKNVKTYNLVSVIKMVSPIIIFVKTTPIIL